jgi:hypothetical protein
MAKIDGRTGWYHPDVLAALHIVMKSTEAQVVRQVHLKALFDGAVLADDVYSLSGILLCAKGQEVTPSMRMRLRNYYINVGIQMPIKIFAPLEGETVPERVFSPIASGSTQ